MARSAHQILEEVAKAEATERSRRSLERRLRISGIKRFKPMADFDWSWPTKIERDIIERALTLDFLGETRNLILVGRNGLGKTMIAQNIAHAAVLAGYTGVASKHLAQWISPVRQPKDCRTPDASKPQLNRHSRSSGPWDTWVCPAIPRASQYSAHHTLHGFGAEPVQGFLAGLRLGYRINKLISKAL